MIVIKAGLSGIIYNSSQENSGKLAETKNCDLLKKS
jgi:hypothetical protein